MYKKALPLAEGLGNYPEVTAISYGLAALSRSEGEFKTAQKHLARGIANQVKHPHLPINLYCLLSMGAVKSGLQEYDNAQMWFERAAEQATRMGYPRHYSDALVGQGEIYKNQGNLALAEEKYQEALSVLPASAMGRSGLIELNLCAVLMAKGEFARCRQRLENARRDVEQLKTKSASLVLDILMTPDVITQLSDEAWADWMHGIEKRLAQTHYADPDVGLAFELSATQAESKGFIERSRSVLAQAEQQWTQLGRPKRIQAVQKWRKLLGP